MYCNIVYLKTSIYDFMKHQLKIYCIVLEY